MLYILTRASGKPGELERTMGNQNRRQTKRDRKQDARQRRLEEIRRRQRQARVRRIGGIVVVLAVIAAITGMVVLAGQSSRKGKTNLDKLALAAGCTKLQEPPDRGRGHINPPAKGTFSSKPPTSGSHYNTPGLGPVATGVHAEPIPDEGQLHNLEHGHIGIQYKSLDPSILADLTALVRGDPTFLFIAPYPDMEYNLAFTAWGKLLGCASPNAKAVGVAKEFIKQFRDKAPESVPGSPLPASRATPPPANPSTAPPSSPSPTAKHS